MRPIVLHHGLFGFDKIEIKNFRLNYWGKVPDLLSKLGYKVYISKVGKTQSIEQRSIELHKFMKRHDIKDAHLVCHSLGGLDARFLLDRYITQEDKVNISTLTTLGSPHHGSEFMDLLSLKLGLGYRYNKVVDCPTPKSVLYQLMYYLDQPAYSCLTTEYCKYFNKTVSINPMTKYFSIGASFKCKQEFIHDTADSIVHNELKDMPLLKILTLKKLEDYMGLLERITFIMTNELNDGLVTLKSSHFEKQLTHLEGSHWDLVDKSGRFGYAMEEPVEEMYLKIVTNLKKFDE